MAGTAVSLTSCEDKDTPEAPRLFSPVVTTSVNANSLVCTWQGIKEAVSYELTLQRALPNPAEDGSIVYEDVRVVNIEVDPTGTTPYSPYTFENLDWDERYRVNIKAIGTNKESRVYTTEYTTLSYPTKLKAVNTLIDTAAKIEWSEGNDVDIAYMNVFVRNADGTVTPWTHQSNEEAESQSEYYYTVTDKDLEASYAEIYALQPETDFRVIAYSADGEYRGRRDFRTQAAEVFENPDLVVDLRMEDTDTLKASLFETLPDGAVLLLKGGTSYITTGTPKITKNFTMRTGMSLSGKATVMCGGFAAEGNIANIRIENLKYTCLPTDDKSSNFGGRYFFNNGDLYNIGNLTFEDVEVVAMRGFIRTRKDDQHIDNVVFNNCILDSIGGYKLIHLDTNNTSIGTVKITNSTMSNIEGVVRANNRDNTNIDKIEIENCTFAFAGNGALFMLKRDGCCENISFSMSDCVVGGNFPDKTAEGGTFNSGATVAYRNVYVAKDFGWALDADGAPKNPFGDFKELSIGYKDLWVAPEKGDFTYKSGSFECAEAGDPRWRVAR